MNLEINKRTYSLYKLALGIVIIFILMNVFISRISAASIFDFSKDWGLGDGASRFLNPNLYWALDFEGAEWNQPVEKVLFAIADFFMTAYRLIMQIIVNAYYYAMSFKFIKLLEPLSIGFIERLYELFFTKLSGFLTAGMMLGILVYFGKQNFQKLIQTIGIYFLLLATMTWLMSTVSLWLPDTIDTVALINQGVSSSFVEDDNSEDAVLDMTARLWKNMYVDGFVAINGEGVLSEAQVEALLEHPKGSSERNSLTDQYVADYKVFNRDITNSGTKAISSILAAGIGAIEGGVVFLFTMMNLANELVFLMLISLFPIVFFLTVIPFFGLRSLTSYAFELFRSILSMIVVSIIIGFVTLVSITFNSATSSMPWAIGLILKGIIIFIMYKYRDRIIRTLRRVVGVANFNDFGMGNFKMPRRSNKSKNPEGNDSRDNNSKRNAGDDTDDPKDLDLNNKENDKPSARQMKYARDLEKENGSHSDVDFESFSKREMSDYIDTLKKDRQDRSTSDDEGNEDIQDMNLDNSGSSTEDVKSEQETQEKEESGSHVYQDDNNDKETYPKNFDMDTSNHDIVSPDNEQSENPSLSAKLDDQPRNADDSEVEHSNSDCEENTAEIIGHNETDELIHENKENVSENDDIEPDIKENSSDDSTFSMKPIVKKHERESEDLDTEEKEEDIQENNQEEQASYKNFSLEDE